MGKKLSPDTTAIIKAIAAAQQQARTVADTVESELKKHTESDDERFAALTTLVESVSNDVKSLLNSRQFFRGAWWAIVGMAALVGSGVAAVWHYIHG